MLSSSHTPSPPNPSKPSAVCQALRILSFTSTQLPGPSYHCRGGEPTAVRPWVSHWSEHLVVDVSRQLSKSCGDLIFSSHTTFVVLGVMTYLEFGSHRLLKVAAVASGALISVLIIASRKHYTVDVVIAWYVVPLVFKALGRRWTVKRGDDGSGRPPPPLPTGAPPFCLHCGRRTGGCETVELRELLCTGGAAQQRSGGTADVRVVHLY